MIQSPFLFRIVAEVEGRNGNWYPGSYKIPGGSSFFEICKIMSKPAGDIRVTFRRVFRCAKWGPSWRMPASVRNRNSSKPANPFF